MDREEPGTRSIMDDPTPATALAQLAGIVLAEPHLPAALARVAQLAVSVVPGCDGSSVTMRGDGQPAATAADSDWSRRLDERQYAEQEGPCLDCLREGSVMRVRDIGSDSRFPSYGPRAAACGAASVLSLPLAGDGRTVGALNLYSRKADAFDSAALAAGEILVAHASLAVQTAAAYYTHRDLADQMREAITSRAVIEQAKGVLVAQRKCTPDAAFELLVAASQRNNTKLREVAERLVAGAQKG